jgi:hypothetical protein
VRPLFEEVFAGGFEPWEVPRRMNGMYSEESAKAIKAAQALAE